MSKSQVMFQNIKGFALKVSKCQLNFLRTLKISKKHLQDAIPKCSEDSKKHKLVPCCDSEVIKIKGTETLQVDPETPQPKVVVIGAGMAGLSAAHRLISRGIKNVVVLEARDRPGGRIHSCRLGDAVAEMGAGWIEGGCVANSVYNLAATEGLLGPPILRRELGTGLYLTSDGRAITTSIDVNSIMENIQFEASSLFGKTSKIPYQNLLEFFKKKQEQELREIIGEEMSDVSRILLGLTNAMRAKWGEDLSELSVGMYGSHIQIPGGDVLLPLGMTGILAPLLRDIPTDQVKYCKMVQTVVWSSKAASDSRVTIKCCDGEEVTADFVIVTVSLGFLKSQGEKFFCPPLPSEKLNAISTLGFGHINKIFVEFKEPFWIKGEATIHPAWTESELSEKTDWVKGIGIIESVPKTHNVLCFTVGGKEAVQMEKACDVHVAEDVIQFLRKLTGDSSLPCPTKVMRSKWSTDMTSLGACSFMGLNSDVGHQCVLAEPLRTPDKFRSPAVLFAGEATCPGHFGTLHGARISGVREADRIIRITVHHKGPPPNPTPDCCL